MTRSLPPAGQEFIYVVCTTLSGDVMLWQVPVLSATAKQLKVVNCRASGYRTIIRRDEPPIPRFTIEGAVRDYIESRERAVNNLRKALEEEERRLQEARKMLETPPTAKLAEATY